MHYCASLEISTIHERGSGLKLAFTWRTGADFPPNSVFRPGVVKPPNLPPRPVNELGAAVDDLLEKMATFSRIFGLICTFLPYAESFGDFLDVKLYNFYKIVIDYGPAASRDYSVIVNWNVKNSKFHLAFGSHSQRKNPHTTIAADLNSTLNSNQNLAEILQILVETWPVYEAVGRLWTAPIFTKDDFTTVEIEYKHRCFIRLLPLRDH